MAVAKSFGDADSLTNAARQRVWNVMSRSEYPTDAHLATWSSTRVTVPGQRAESVASARSVYRSVRPRELTRTKISVTSL